MFECNPEAQQINTDFSYNMDAKSNGYADPCMRINLNEQPSADQIFPESSDDQQSKNQHLVSGGDVMEMINQMYSENKKMTKMVSEIFQNYTLLHSRLMQYLSSKHEIRKRNADHLDNNLPDDDGNCCKRMKMMNVKPKVSTVLIRVDSSNSSLVVKDGYQWRKYGQKVTRDNPSPRAYFKCSFAPLCPVKKKVQKSNSNPTILVVTYEGEHSHKKGCSHGSILTPSTIIESSSSINVSPSSIFNSSPDHLIRHDNDDHVEKGSDNEDGSLVQQWLLEKMASSLTKDPSFASALATAISDKILEQTFC